MLWCQSAHIYQVVNVRDRNRINKYKASCLIDGETNHHLKADELTHIDRFLIDISYISNDRNIRYFCQ